MLNTTLCHTTAASHTQRVGAWNVTVEPKTRKFNFLFKFKLIEVEIATSEKGLLYCTQCIYEERHDDP